MEDVYERMTDSELEYAVERSYEEASHAVDVYAAGLILDHYGESDLFDRLVLGFNKDVLTQAENYFDKAINEHSKGMEEAEKRGLELDEYRFDMDEEIEETVSTLSELMFDRVGLYTTNKSTDKRRNKIRRHITNVGDKHHFRLLTQRSKRHTNSI